MAATDPQSMMVDEVVAQLTPVLSPQLKSGDYFIGQEWPDGQTTHWHHDDVVVRPGPDAWQLNTNEHDTHEFSIGVALLTSGAPDQGENVIQTLLGWARIVRRTLGERASRASPLRTNPLPLTGHDLAAADAAFNAIRFGQTQNATGEVSDGIYRHGLVVPVLIRTQEVATA